MIGVHSGILDMAAMFLDWLEAEDEASEEEGEYEYEDDDELNSDLFG